MAASQGNQVTEVAMGRKFTAAAAGRPSQRSGGGAAK
jgi:hypothetical protein